MNSQRSLPNWEPAHVAVDLIIVVIVKGSLCLGPVDIGAAAVLVAQVTGTSAPLAAVPAIAVVRVGCGGEGCWWVRCWWVRCWWVRCWWWRSWWCWCGWRGSRWRRGCRYGRAVLADFTDHIIQKIQIGNSTHVQIHHSRHVVVVALNHRFGRSCKAETC